MPKPHKKPWRMESHRLDYASIWEAMKDGEINDPRMLRTAEEDGDGSRESNSQVLKAAGSGDILVTLSELEKRLHVAILTASDKLATTFEQLHADQVEHHLNHRRKIEQMFSTVNTAKNVLGNHHDKKNVLTTRLSKVTLDEKDKNNEGSNDGNGKVHGSLSNKVAKQSEAISRKKSRDDSVLHDSVLARIVMHKYFDQGIGLVILFNSLLVGFQINHAATSDDDATHYDFLECFCTIVFTLELMMRIIVFKAKLFDRTEISWSLFDLTLVTCSWLDFASITFEGGAVAVGPIAILLRLVKFVRMARILRALKVARFLHNIEVMIKMIMNTMTQLLWLFILMLGVMYIFAVVLTTLITDWRKPAYGTPPVGWAYDEATRFFGSITQTMYTLYTGMCGGLDWSEHAEILEQTVGKSAFYIYIGFISFTVFSVMNVVTGVYCDAAIAQANGDRAKRLEKLAVEQKRVMQTLGEMLSMVDTDGSGIITREEWAESLQDEDVLKMLRLLEIDATDVHHLYELLDHDNDGNVSINEFVEGLMKAKGVASSLDVHMLVTRVNAIHHKLRQW